MSERYVKQVIVVRKDLMLTQGKLAAMVAHAAMTAARGIRPARLAPFPIDSLLRRHGWQIASRPKGDELPRWHHAGKRLTLGQPDALDCIPLSEVERARRAEETYLLHTCR